MIAGNELVEMPSDQWDRWVSAAYIRSLGGTQTQAAKAVGRAERTIRLWEADERWPQAMEEARDRWLSGIEGAARKTLLSCLSGGKNGDLALKVLERLEPALSPHRKDPSLDLEIPFFVFGPEDVIDQPIEELIDQHMLGGETGDSEGS